MASNYNTPPDPMISSGQTLIPAIPRRRKHRGPGIAVAFRLRRTQKKHSAGNSSFPANFWEGLQKSDEASARKLAAGLWQWRFMEVSPDGGGVSSRYAPSFPSSMYRLANGNANITFPRHHNSGEKLKEIRDQQRKPITILRSRNGLQCELKSSMPYLKCSKEGETKWNPALNSEAYDNGMKHLEDKKDVGDCYFGVTNLLELVRAQRSINKLKATQKSTRKRVQQFLQNLEDKKVLWKCRECQKIEKKLDHLKDKLARERRSRERMELLNTKLVHELAKANLSAKKYMTNYKKEKKERKVIEEVCNELAMQVREDMAKLKRLLSNSVKICKEVEEEREMMEMAELWREERVQMKLVDAQFLLENKYNQMVQLIAFLQMFLRSRGAELDTTELEDAQLIKQVVESVNIKRILELSYDFSKLDNTVSTFEELRRDNKEEGMTESLDEQVLNKNSILNQSCSSNDYVIELELTNSSETIGYIEDQKFSSMPQRGDTYSVDVNQDNKDTILGSDAECRQGITISSTKPSQHRSLGDGWHKQKECNYRLPTSSVQNAGSTSQCKGSVEGSFKHSELLEQGNSTYNMNPHMFRGMRGCTKLWPRGIPKSNFEVTPFGKE